MRNARTLRAIALRAALAAGVAAAALVPSGAAVAGSDVVRDDAGDASAMAILSESEGLTQARARRGGDITSVRTTYARRTITVTTRMRALPHTVFASVELTTPAGGRRYGILAAGSPGEMETGLFRGQDSDNLLPCDGLTVRPRPRRQTLTIRFPAACVGSPRWVRTAVAVTTVRGPAPAELAWPGALEDLKVFLDVAGMAGMTDEYFNSPTTRLPLGPKVRRG